MGNPVTLRPARSRLPTQANDTFASVLLHNDGDVAAPTKRLRFQTFFPEVVIKKSHSYPCRFRGRCRVRVSRFEQTLHRHLWSSPAGVGRRLPPVSISILQMENPIAALGLPLLNVAGSRSVHRTGTVKGRVTTGPLIIPQAVGPRSEDFARHQRRPWKAVAVGPFS